MFALKIILHYAVSCGYPIYFKIHFCSNYNIKQYFIDVINTEFSQNLHVKRIRCRKPMCLPCSTVWWKHWSHQQHRWISPKNKTAEGDDFIPSFPVTEAERSRTSLRRNDCREDDALIETRGRQSWGTKIHPQMRWRLARGRHGAASVWRRAVQHRFGVWATLLPLEEITFYLAT